MLSLDRNDILRVISSSDEGGLLIGHTDVLSRTAEHRGHVEVGNFTLLYDMNVKRPVSRRSPPRNSLVYGHNIVDLVQLVVIRCKIT